MTRTCEECGASWGRDARWCATCGQALVEVEPTVGPTIDADGDRGRSEGRWRRWVMGVGLLAVVVAGGVLASQQVVGEGAEDDVDGGIGLPESEPAEPNGAPRNPEPGDPFGEDPGASQPTCTRDDVEIPDCPRLLRTGLEPIGPPTDELMFTREGSALVAVELRTGQERWELDLAGEISVAPVGQDVVVQSGVDGLRRVDADGQVRWHVEDAPGFHVDVVEAGDAGTLAVVRAPGALTARSVEDGAQLWSTPLSDLDDDFAGQEVEVRGTAGTTLLLEGWGATDTGVTAVAIDAATGARRWNVPPVEGGRLNIAATTADLVVVRRSEHDDDGSDTWWIEVRDALTGTLRWDVTPEVIDGLWGDGVAVTDDVVVREGPDSVVARSLATGEVAWQAPPGAVFETGWLGLGPGLDHLDTADGAVVVTREDRLERLEPSTGEVLWSVETTSRDVVGFARATRAVRLTFGEQGLPRVYVYDLADGSELVALQADPNILSEDPLVLFDVRQGRLLLVPDEVMERRDTP